MSTVRPLICAAVAALIAAGALPNSTPASPSVPAPAGPAVAEDARVTLVSCHRALRPRDRHLTVEAAMRRRPGAQGMRIRFDLQRRSGPGATFASVPAPGLRRQHRAAPGVDTYRFRKTIRNLPGPADYRVAVTFGWLKPDGSLLAEVVQVSGICQQTDQRPDLRVAAVQAVADGPGRATYSVTVVNSGAGGSPPFTVALAVAGGRQPSVRVGGLAGGATTTVRVDAPACAPGQGVVAAVDPARRVNETSETNNARGVPCPL